MRKMPVADPCDTAYCWNCLTTCYYYYTHILCQVGHNILTQPIKHQAAEAITADNVVVVIGMKLTWETVVTWPPSGLRGHSPPAAVAVQPTKLPPLPCSPDPDPCIPGTHTCRSFKYFHKSKIMNTDITVVTYKGAMNCSSILRWQIKNSVKQRISAARVGASMVSQYFDAIGCMTEKGSKYTSTFSDCFLYFWEFSFSCFLPLFFQFTVQYSRIKVTESVLERTIKHIVYTIRKDEASRWRGEGRCCMVTSLL